VSRATCRAWRVARDAIRYNGAGLGRLVQAGAVTRRNRSTHRAWFEYRRQKHRL